MTIVDITYQTNIGERHGRRRLYDNHTGEMWWEPEEPSEEIAPVIMQAMQEEEKITKPRHKKLHHG
jgi:hypothetical protein